MSNKDVFILGSVEQYNWLMRLLNDTTDVRWRDGSAPNEEPISRSLRGIVEHRDVAIIVGGVIEQISLPVDGLNGVHVLSLMNTVIGAHRILIENEVYRIESKEEYDWLIQELGCNTDVMWANGVPLENFNGYESSDEEFKGTSAVIRRGNLITTGRIPYAEMSFPEYKFTDVTRIMGGDGYDVDMAEPLTETIAEKEERTNREKEFWIVSIIGGRAPGAKTFRFLRDAYEYAMDVEREEDVFNRELKREFGDDRDKILANGGSEFKVYVSKVTTVTEVSLDGGVQNVWRGKE